MSFTIAITGSKGFIGSRLVKYFDSLNYKVIQLDIENNVDVCDWKQLSKVPKFDLIIHLAAKLFVPDSFKYPHLFYSVNFNTTLNVLELARLHNARVIYFSSYLYGAPEKLPINELHRISPHNPYARTKVLCENLCEGYNKDFNLPITIFRPFNIYGEGQNDNFLIPSIIKQFKNGKVVLQDHRPKRDYIYIDDIVKAVGLAVIKDLKQFEVFNLGTGKSYSVSEIVDIIKSKTDSVIDVVYTNQFRKDEVLDTVADISKAKTLLGWIPSVTIEEGIDRMIANY